MADFSNAEMPDMVLTYGQARLRENGKFQPCCNDRGRERTERVLDAEEEILNSVGENPRISVRRLSYRIGVSPFVV
ncbi:hypothetical protein Zmor_026363 [Zophobas morio]|uniref:Uncharacterized protein n=1 Tax=Zophobas morio TaxID=2755281 RepID=A0AA38HUA9_9CUCU|nr:hypothetical protein Zmor_026363 [Zophobas morio]